MKRKSLTLGLAIASMITLPSLTVAQPAETVPVVPAPEAPKAPTSAETYLADVIRRIVTETLSSDDITSAQAVVYLAHVAIENPDLVPPSMPNSGTLYALAVDTVINSGKHPNKLRQEAAASAAVTLIATPDDFEALALGQQTPVEYFAEHFAPVYGQCPESVRLTVLQTFQTEELKSRQEFDAINAKIAALKSSKDAKRKEKRDLDLQVSRLIAFVDDESIKLVESRAASIKYLDLIKAALTKENPPFFKVDDLKDGGKYFPPADDYRQYDLLLKQIEREDLKTNRVDSRLIDLLKPIYTIKYQAYQLSEEINAIDEQIKLAKALLQDPKYGNSAVAIMKFVSSTQACRSSKLVALVSESLLMQTHNDLLVFANAAAFTEANKQFLASKGKGLAKGEPGAPTSAADKPGATQQGSAGTRPTVSATAPFNFEQNPRKDVHYPSTDYRGLREFRETLLPDETPSPHKVKGASGAVRIPK